MVLAHNLTAMNAQRQFNIVGTAKRKSTEKLSSGYKINRAADDAAGLSISEKMRKQIRGLDRASDNCQDGVSLCQVADGALAETHEILQRINELSIQSANGTNSSSDRAAIQAEVKQLTDEIDRIATTTSFNERIFPLNQGISADSRIASKDGDVWLLPASLVDSQVQRHLTSDLKYNGLDGNNTIVTMKGVNLMESVYNGDRIVLNGGWAESDGTYGWAAGSDGAYDLSVKDLRVDEEGFIYYEEVSPQHSGRKMYLINQKIINAPGASLQSYIEATTSKSKSEEIEDVHSGGYDYQSQSIYLKAEKVIQFDQFSSYSNLVSSLSIHAGSESDMALKIPVNIVNATKKGLGLTDPEIDLSTEDGATAAIDRVKNAI